MTSRIDHDQLIQETPARFRSKRATRSFRFSERVTLDAGRHHVKLPRIGLVKTHESVRKLARRIEAGSARIGRATIAFHRGYEVRPDVSRVADDKFRC